MKVEFMQSEYNGAELLAEGSEFLKAKTDEEQFNSLVFAVDAFASCLGFKISFLRDDYDNIMPFVKRTSLVIFCLRKDEYQRTRWCEAHVFTNNRLVKVVEIEEYI